MIERLTYFTAKKNTFDYDDHYYNASTTRFGQTISWRKRHTPAFQIFVDLVVSMLVCNIFLGTMIYNYRRYLAVLDDPDLPFYHYEWNRHNFFEYVVATTLTAKAFSGCLWYRFHCKGNRVEMTYELFGIRVGWDLLLVLTCVLYYCLCSVEVLTLFELILALTLIVAFNVAQIFVMMMRANEKLNQKRFEANLRKHFLAKEQ